jgi:hypothetical protein
VNSPLLLGLHYKQRTLRLEEWQLLHCPVVWTAPASSEVEMIPLLQGEIMTSHCLFQPLAEQKLMVTYIYIGVGQSVHGGQDENE